MALSDAARRDFNRAVAEIRRGRVSSADMAADLIERLLSKGILVSEKAPDLSEMARALTEAGYTVEPPASAAPVVPAADGP